jgi:hypothetical protein
VAPLIDLRRNDAVYRDWRAVPGHAQLFGPHEQVDHGTGCRALQRRRGDQHPRWTKRERRGWPVDLLKACVQHVDVADERRDETIDRMAIDFVRSAQLADAALRKDGDPVGQAERLALVVGDEDGRHAELALNLLDLDLH